MSQNQSPITEQSPAPSIQDLRKNVKTLAIKCYPEQVPNGHEDLVNRIKATSRSDYQILMIQHDRDVLENGTFAKPHYMIIVRVMDTATTTSSNGRKIQTILNHLGIVFRLPEDETLINNGALQCVRDFGQYALYLTHETPKAIAEKKTLYSTSEIVSNLDPATIAQIREAKKEVQKQNGRKELDAKLRQLDVEAEELGYNLGDFDAWYHALPLALRSAAKMKQIKESYAYGAEKRLKHDTYVNRLCIFITGPANSGKSFTSELALKEMGIGDYITIGGGGSGKLDNLKPSTKALIVDDDTIPEALNTCDNKMCHVYRRNKNNPIWAGSLIVVTSNKSFDAWAKSCGYSLPEHIEALRSRFYICSLEQENGIRSLKCSRPSKRGEAEQQEERKELFKRFRTMFNESLKNYTEEAREVDYSDLND